MDTQFTITKRNGSKSDEIRVTVLEDGTIKMEADKISMPNHSSAEGFIREVSRLAGGTATRKAKTKHAHGTHGTHEHEKDHEHH